MTELSPEARRLLGLARRGDDPREIDRARLNQRMSQRLALAASVTGASLGMAKVASGATIATLLGKGLATGVVATAAVFGAWKAADHVDLWRRAAPATPSVRVTPSASVTSATTIDPHPQASNREQGIPNNEVVIVLEPTNPSGVTATPPTKNARIESVQKPVTKSELGVPESESDVLPTEEVPDPLQQEVAALREAQQAIGVGQAQRALALVAEQDQRFAGGALQQERAAARVFALCNLGRRAEARGEAHSFEKRWPRSPLIARVRRACEAESPQ